MRNPSSKGLERIERVIEELRASAGISKVALQGYCWGGRLAIYAGK